jgi:uncharacterized protein YukE
MSSVEMGQGQGALSAAAALVADAKGDFDRLDDELVRHIEAARARWVGAGGAAFVALGTAWADKQRTIVAALQQFEASLRATERDNLATDDAQSAAFARQHRRLG